MNISELILRTLAELEPMVPGLLCAAGATILLLPLLYLRCRKVWMEDRGFAMAGLFFGLDGVGRLRLSCSWLKLVFLIVFIVGFRKLELLNYLMLLLPGLILALTDDSLTKILGGLLWLCLEAAGLLSANMICGYILDMSGSMGFLMVYVAMGLFLVLFGFYLFLNELSGISVQRDVDAGEVWGEVYEEMARPE